MYNIMAIRNPCKFTSISDFPKYFVVIFFHSVVGYNTKKSAIKSIKRSHITVCLKGNLFKKNWKERQSQIGWRIEEKHFLKKVDFSLWGNRFFIFSLLCTTLKQTYCFDILYGHVFHPKIYIVSTCIVNLFYQISSVILSSSPPSFLESHLNFFL